MRNRKKWVLACFALITAAILITAAVTMTACGDSTAASAARTGDNTAKRIDSVVKSMDTATDKQFNFPSAFGDDFAMMNCENGVCVPVTQQSQRPQKYNAYVNRLDELYNMCAGISMLNAQIKQCLTEIKLENNETKRLAKELRKTKADRENYVAIERQHSDTKSNLDRLYKHRGQITKSTKRLPNSGDNINVEAMTARYSAIKDKLEHRHRLLVAVKESIQDANRTMLTTIGIQQHSPQSARTELISRPHKPQQNTQQETRRTPPIPAPRTHQVTEEEQKKVEKQNAEYAEKIRKYREQRIQERKQQPQPEQQVQIPAPHNHNNCPDGQCA